MKLVQFLESQECLLPLDERNAAVTSLEHLDTHWWSKVNEWMEDSDTQNICDLSFVLLRGTCVFEFGDLCCTFDDSDAEIPIHMCTSFVSQKHIVYLVFNNLVKELDLSLIQRDVETSNDESSLIITLLFSNVKMRVIGVNDHVAEFLNHLRKLNLSKRNHFPTEAIDDAAQDIPKSFLQFVASEKLRNNIADAYRKYCEAVYFPIKLHSKKSLDSNTYEDMETESMVEKELEALKFSLFLDLAAL